MRSYCSRFLDPDVPHRPPFVEFDFDYSSTIRRGEWSPFPDKGRLMVTKFSRSYSRIIGIRWRTNKTYSNRKSQKSLPQWGKVAAACRLTDEVSFFGSLRSQNKRYRRQTVAKNLALWARWHQLALSDVMTLISFCDLTA